MGKQDKDPLIEMVEKFESGEYILDQDAIRHGNNSEIRLMSTRFPSQLVIFKNAYEEANLSRELRSLLIDNKPKYDYGRAREEFEKCVMILKANDLIINKADNDKMKKYEEENKRLNNQVEQQKNIINTYVNKIEAAIELFPDLKKVFGINDGDIKDD